VPVLILDESTSSVDTETEFLIQQALERLRQGTTDSINASILCSNGSNCSVRCRWLWNMPGDDNGLGKERI
jgi:hypothetical protein